MGVIDPVSLHATSEAGLRTTASYSPPVRSQLESWICRLAVDDILTCSDAFADVQRTVADLQEAGYDQNPELLAATEAVLVALLGHHVNDIREAAVVTLNMLYDGHSLQADDALHITIACVEDAPTITVPLVIDRLHNFNPALLEQRVVVLRVFGPHPERKRPPAWKEYTLRFDRHSTAIQATFPQFACPGYYDWIIAPPGDTSPAFMDALPVDTPRRLKGRFIVQPKNTRETVMIEVPVDEVDAVWDENTGHLRSRGSFDSVLTALPKLKLAGANTIYLMGALERPADDPDASPFAVVDRSTPASVLGGSSAFRNLVAEATRLGLKIVVDAFDRVSRTRMHRKYRYLTVETLNTRGIPLRHPGTDGRENQWEDTALLNYRRIETWNLMIAEIKSLASKYGIRGIHLDNAQSLPPILAPNTDELFRLDSDQKPHYTLSEIFYGAVVRANVEYGFWTSDAGVEGGYPNPFLVKLCRELWNEYPDFVIIAESNFHREPALLTSGVVAHSIRIPQILASISGKSLRRDGTVSRIPENKRSTARTLSRLFKNDRAELPKNSILVNCTCTHLSPFPGVLYGRRAWLAVDLMFMLPGIPLQLYGESRGRAYRMNAAPVAAHEEISEYDVNFDALLPKSPTKRAGHSSPADGAVPVLSLGSNSLALAAAGRAPSSPLSAPVLPRSGGGPGVSPSAGTNLALPVLQKGTLAAGTTPLGGLLTQGSTGTFVNNSQGLMRFTQIQQQSQQPAAPTTALPPVSDKRPKLKRRGSLADLRRTPSQTSLVRSRSKDDMRGGAVRSLSVEQLRKMSALEEEVRQEIDPHSGFDISQIQGHYTHRLLTRQQHSALRHGAMCILAVDPQHAEQVFAFARFTDTEIVLVAINFADGREHAHYAHGCDVELDLRAMWEFLPSTFTDKAGLSALYTIEDTFSDVVDPADSLTLEELTFRRYHVHLDPLGVRVFKLCAIDDTADNRSAHYAMCLQRLQVSESADLKDPRENFAVSELARGAASSVSSFATALNNLRDGLRQEGCDDDSVLRILLLCIQRASQLVFMVAYEGVPPPKDFDPPVAERIVAYLTHLSTAARDEELLSVARALVARTTKLGPLVFLSAELGRFSTAGGLGVMVDELTKGLAALGLEVYVISPYYTVDRKNQTGYLGSNISWTRNITVNLGTHVVEVGIFEGVENGVNLIFLERGDYFPKIYADPGGAVRHMQTVVLMSLGSLEICCHKGLVPSLVVSNDWLPSMVSGYRHFFGNYFDNTTFFHLIHNLGDGAYEGRCYPSHQEGALEHIHRLPRHLVMNDAWESKLCNPSRTALMTTDNWGTVSPSYLKELVSGHPLADLLQMAKAPFGYPNGIRKAEREQALRKHGASSHGEAKELIQKKYFGFAEGDPSIPLFAFVGRITSQKGVHLILNAVDELVAHTGGKIQIFVGGPANYSDSYSAGCARHMHDLRRRHPWSFWAGPDDFFTDGPLVNLGADFGLMPSAFEPGGIVQQEFFVAGTPVIAFRTGGLKDTVHEWRSDEMEGNGFTFEGYHHGDFVWAIKRALRVFSHAEEYADLRRSAYETTIDVSQVAWAWSGEFHRLRNACYTRSDIVCHAITASANEPSELLDKESRCSVFRWTNGGSTIILKGSFDGWMAEWVLQPELIENGRAGGDDDSSDPSAHSESVRAITLKLRPGQYMYKFKVDGDWTVASDQEQRRDETGFINNYIEIV